MRCQREIPTLVVGIALALGLSGAAGLLGLLLRDDTTPPPTPRPTASVTATWSLQPVSPRLPVPQPNPRPPAEPTTARLPHAVCADGTLSYSVHRQGTCSHHGGVARWLR